MTATTTIVSCMWKYCLVNPLQLVHKQGFLKKKLGPVIVVIPRQGHTDNLFHLECYQKYARCIVRLICSQAVIRAIFLPIAKTQWLRTSLPEACNSPFLCHKLHRRKMNRNRNSSSGCFRYFQLKEVSFLWNEKCSDEFHLYDFFRDITFE